MSTTKIYPGTSVKITITVTVEATGAVVDPTTLALIIAENDDTLATATVKAITDLTHVSTGVYTYVHRFPSTATPETAYIKASCDAAIDATAITDVTSVVIRETPSQLV